MPIDRKARSQALGAYTFLPTGKKYSFSCATQLDAGTLVEYPSQDYRADVLLRDRRQGPPRCEHHRYKGPQLARHDTLSNAAANLCRELIWTCRD
jgi:hypothetical protein